MIGVNVNVFNYILMKFWIFIILIFFLFYFLLFTLFLDRGLTRVAGTRLGPQCPRWLKGGVASHPNPVRAAMPSPNLSEVRALRPSLALGKVVMPRSSEGRDALACGWRGLDGDPCWPSVPIIIKKRKEKIQKIIKNITTKCLCHRWPCHVERSAFMLAIPTKILQIGSISQMWKVLWLN